MRRVSLFSSKFFQYETKVTYSLEFYCMLLIRKSTFCQKIPFISNLKKPACASKGNKLELATLWYSTFPPVWSNNNLKNVISSKVPHFLSKKWKVKFLVQLHSGPLMLTVQKLGIWVWNKNFLNIHFHHYSSLFFESSQNLQDLFLKSLSFVKIPR